MSPGRVSLMTNKKIFDMRLILGDFTDLQTSIKTLEG